MSSGALRVVESSPKSNACAVCHLLFALVERKQAVLTQEGWVHRDHVRRGEVEPEPTATSRLPRQ